MSDKKEACRVRIAQPEDLDGIMHLARLVNEENGVFKMNEDKVQALVIPCLFKDGGIMGVIGPKDRIEGLVMLRISSYWYSDAQFLEEMCVYVHPEYRQAAGGRASRLVEFAKKAADELGMPLMIGILSNSRTDAKTRLYERQFGHPSGSFFLYNARTGDVSSTPIVN